MNVIYSYQQVRECVINSWGKVINSCQHLSTAIVAVLGKQWHLSTTELKVINSWGILINSCQHLPTVTDKRHHLLTFLPLMMYAPCGRAEKFFALPTTLPVMSKTSASGSTGSEMEASEMEETVLGVEK